MPAFEVNQERTSERASDVFQKMKKLFSDPKYAEQNRILKVSWIPTHKFLACAGPSDDGESDIIAVSDSVALRLNEDAVYFARICGEHFVSDHYKVVFEHSDYGDGISALPSDLTIDEAADRMFRLALAWLYLHEQSHLFQNHAKIAGSEVTVKMAVGSDHIIGINDLSSHSSSKSLRGMDAAISHVIELAADAEALGRAFELCLATDEGQIKKSTLWILLCSVSCLFQHFFGDSPLEILDEPVGSHPNPAFRMRIMVRLLRDLIMNPIVRTRVPWLAAVEDFDRVVEHATTTASMFWTMYTGKQGRGSIPEFFTGVHDVELTPVPYRLALYEAWATLKGPIEQSYRGWGSEIAFNPLSPDSFR